MLPGYLPGDGLIFRDCPGLLIPGPERIHRSLCPVNLAKTQFFDDNLVEFPRLDSQIQVPITVSRVYLCFAIWPSSLEYTGNWLQEDEIIDSSASLGTLGMLCGCHQNGGF